MFIESGELAVPYWWPAAQLRQESNVGIGSFVMKSRTQNISLLKE